MWRRRSTCCEIHDTTCGPFDRRTACSTAERCSSDSFYVYFIWDQCRDSLRDAEDAREEGRSTLLKSGPAVLLILGVRIALCTVVYTWLP